MLIDCSGAVKLTDFGIARAAEFERRTDVGQLKGKLGYMSPEQVIGRELDVLLRIRDADISAIDRNAGRVPDDVRAVLYRALAKDPAQRYLTASGFASALEHVIRRRERRPVAHGRVRRAPRAHRARRGRRGRGHWRHRAARDGGRSSNQVRREATADKSPA